VEGFWGRFSLRRDQAYQALIRKKWMAKIVDNLCLQARSMEELLDRMEVLFEISYECGITLLLDNLEVCTSVKFAGFIVLSGGLKPDPAKMSAVKDFPRLTSVNSFPTFRTPR
jgi:hypothetical protein